MCARNGRALGSWPYNVIRDFSCRDGNFSFTSGRRGPFGVGTYQFQLTPSVLTKLTSAVTMLTGAQFGRTISPEQSSKRRESSSPDHSTSPDRHSAPSDQATISNCSYGDRISPKACAEDTYDRLSKPLHSSYSSSELKSSCAAAQSQSPQPFKKQVSSPGPIRQIKRPRHHYEEIDLPGAVGGATGSPLSSAFTLTSSSSPTTSSLVSTTSHTDPNRPVSYNCEVCTFQTTNGKLRDHKHAESLGNAASAVYENVCTFLLAGGAGEPCARPMKQPLHCALECGRKDVAIPWPQCRDDCCLKCSGSDEDSDGKQTSCADDTYDRPRASLYSVPVCRGGGSGGGVLTTLNARRGCTQVPSLALPTEGMYCNVQSLKSCHQDDGELYEEIDSALGCPRQSSAQLQLVSRDDSHLGSKPAYNISTSVVAQQLAAEEGYELVTSMRHAMLVGQGGSEQLYINQKLHKEMISAKDAESNEESDGYVVVRSPDTPATHSGLAGPARRTHRRMYTNTMDLVPASECVAF